MTYIVRNGKMLAKGAAKLADKARGVAYGAMSDAEVARQRMMWEEAKKKKKKPVFGALSDREAKALRREPKEAKMSKMPRK